MNAMAKEFAYYQSPIGTIKITASDLVISEVQFVDAATEGKPPTHPLTVQCIGELDEYFQGKRKTFTVPVEQDGTPFQLRVWQQLTKIPFGETMSYLQLAKNLGDPKCIRAAGTANGRNRVAILIPCHRVIGSNKSLIGFSGGLWRKKFLLQLEDEASGKRKGELF